MRHAFLVIAHTEYDVLQTLIELLDNPCCDIYIHIDKKSKLPNILKTSYARIFLLKKRIDTRWGHVSLIRTEMLLFETALANGPYEYYHLLSGTDLLIKPLDYFFDFFNKYKGKEFVGFSSKNDTSDKVMRYRFGIRYYKMKGRCVTYLKLLCYRLERIADKLHKRSDESFKKGSEWVSITEDFCSYLVGKKHWIFRRFRYTFCGDEIFLQTVLWNSPYRANIYSLDNEFNGCLREIIWENDNPHVWGSSPNDIDYLQKSNKFFARKFSSAYPDIIKEVQKMVKIK